MAISYFQIIIQKVRVHHWLQLMLRLWGCSDMPVEWFPLFWESMNCKFYEYFLVNTELLLSNPKDTSQTGFVNTPKNPTWQQSTNILTMDIEQSMKQKWTTLIPDTSTNSFSLTKPIISETMVSIDSMNAKQTLLEKRKIQNS